MCSHTSAQVYLFEEATRSSCLVPFALASASVAYIPHVVNSGVSYFRLLGCLPVCIFASSKVTLKNKEIKLLISRRK